MPNGNVILPVLGVLKVNYTLTLRGEYYCSNCKKKIKGIRISDIQPLPLTKSRFAVLIKFNFCPFVGSLCVKC